MASAGYQWGTDRSISSCFVSYSTYRCFGQSLTSPRIPVKHNITRETTIPPESRVPEPTRRQDIPRGRLCARGHSGDRLPGEATTGFACTATMFFRSLDVHITPVRHSIPGHRRLSEQTSEQREFHSVNLFPLPRKSDGFPNGRYHISAIRHYCCPH